MTVPKPYSTTKTHCFGGFGVHHRCRHNTRTLLHHQSLYQDRLGAQSLAKSARFESPCLGPFTRCYNPVRGRCVETRRSHKVAEKCNPLPLTFIFVFEKC